MKMNMGIVIRTSCHAVEKIAMEVKGRLLGLSRRAKRTAVPPIAKATGNPRARKKKRQANISRVVSSTLNLLLPH